jgi:DNA excision repair protein ERCC-2
MSDCHHYKISVAELLEFNIPAGDLHSAAGDRSRAREGIAGHQLIKSLRPEGYQSEVPVEQTFQWENLTLTVHGRIDGLTINRSEIIVEEIKTTYQPVTNLVDPYPIHLAQLNIYLYLVMVRYPHQKVTGRLTYLNLENLAEKSFPAAVSFGEAQANFEALAVKCLTFQKTNLNWIEIRNRSLNELIFPFPQLRPGQTELMSAVTQALQQEQDLFIEAATGIGKTISALIPALKHLAAEPSLRRIFFLTAKTAGKEILRTTLEDLMGKGLRLRSVFIEAKERVCLCPNIQCDFCQFAENYYERVESVLPRLLCLELVTPELISETAKEERLCPFEISLDLALRADLIICDYNYLFDPGVYLRRFFLTSKRESIFLIDEAHNLVNRGREMYSAALSHQEVLSWSEGLKIISSDLAAAGEKVAAVFEEYLEELRDSNQQALLLPSLHPELEPALEQWSGSMEKAMRQDPPAQSQEQLKTVYFGIIRFIQVISSLNQDYAIFLKNEDRNLTLRILCLNPGPLLRKRLDKGRSTIFFSATLSPYEYFRELLGGRDDSLHLRLPSPFPKENRLYLHLPGIDTRFRSRTNSLAQLADCIGSVVQARSGNYLVFFPSYSYLQSALPLLRRNLASQALVYAQFPGMGDQQRRQFLNKLFGNHPNETKIGLAVLGGSFGEGIDLPGEQLIGAIIVGPGLPMVNEEQELIRMYFDERDNSGFFHAYLVPGLIKVIQAAGRVFRTPDDMGVVILIDDRFGDERYQELLPPDWFLPGRPFSDPEYRITLEKFWGENCRLTRPLPDEF